MSRPLAMAPNDSPQRLGKYLPCTADTIDAALREFAARPRRAPVRLGEMLLAGEVISATELHDALTAQRVDRLRGCALFSVLSASELARLSRCFVEVSVEDGGTVIEQGRIDPHLYVIASGELEVFRRGDDGVELVVTRLKPGEPAGEMGFVSSRPRTASVRALGRCNLLKARFEALREEVEEIPNLSHAFLEVVTRRLANTTLLFEQGQRRLRKVEQSLQSLGDYLDLSDAAAVGQGIESLLERLVHTASEIVDADRASLFLLDRTTGELWSKVAEGAEIREIRVPPGKGVAGWVAEHRAMVNIVDAYDDARFHQDVDRKTGYRTRSILCAPIWNLQQEILGVVQVVNKYSGRFTAQDETLMRAFAHQAAVAVENFKLYQDIVSSNRRMALLLELSTSLSETLDLEALIGNVVAKTAAALGCERSSFFVVDDENRELWSLESTGSELAEIRIPLSTGLAGDSVTTGRIVNVVDAYTDTRFNREVDQLTGYRTRSVLCVPVVNREEKTTGVIQCINKAGGVFGDDDVRLLRAIASAVSVALDNAQLFERVRNMSSYLESVQESIASGIVTLDERYAVITSNRAAAALLSGHWRGDVRETAGRGNPVLIDALARAYDRREAVSAFDVPFRTERDELRSVNLNAVPLQEDESFKGLVLVLEDITSERRVKTAFSQYLAPAVIDRLLADPSRLALGGEKREVTALFTDIQGFTSVAERLGPDALVRLLNEYFDETCAIVLRYGGTIDKIVGDSLHVLFNAPLAQPDHAERAVRCALDLDACCRRLVARQGNKGEALGQTRLGINTGLSIVGNFGGAARFDYTAHGDAVNTAARLESVNRYLGTRICVSGSTRRACPSVAFRPVGALVLKGKSEPTEVFEPLPEGESDSARVRQYLEAYEALASGAGDVAERFADLAQRHPEDGLIAFHAERLAQGGCGAVVYMEEK